MDLRHQIEQAIHVQVRQIAPLSGGCVGQVFRVSLTNGLEVVAKFDESDSALLNHEGYMLKYLARNSNLPVPEVLFSSSSLLLMSLLEGESRFSSRAQEHAAELLATLHNISAPAFGFEQDTLIGGLHQPNPWTRSWVKFFRDQRLIYMAAEGLRLGRLPGATYARLERFCDHLDSWIEDPDHPALIHGDAWTANILAEGDRIVGFIDPAIYYADQEIELAFTTLFNTFSSPFFDRYQELSSIRSGFFEERCDIYNLYPLLVHVRLFGGSYVSSVETTLRRFGF